MRTRVKVDGSVFPHYTMYWERDYDAATHTCGTQVPILEAQPVARSRTTNVHIWFVVTGDDRTSRGYDAKMREMERSVYTCFEPERELPDVRAGGARMPRRDPIPRLLGGARRALPWLERIT